MDYENTVLRPPWNPVSRILIPRLIKHIPARVEVLFYCTNPNCRQSITIRVDKGSTREESYCCRARYRVTSHDNGDVDIDRLEDRSNRKELENIDTVLGDQDDD